MFWRLLICFEEDKLELALCCIMYVTARDSVPINWDAVAREVDPNITGEALKQQIAKRRSNRIMHGLSAPPANPRSKPGIARVHSTPQSEIGSPLSSVSNVKTTATTPKTPKNPRGRKPRSKVKSSARVNESDSEDDELAPTPAGVALRGAIGQRNTGRGQTALAVSATSTSDNSDSEYVPTGESKKRGRSSKTARNEQTTSKKSRGKKAVVDSPRASPFRSDEETVEPMDTPVLKESPKSVEENTMNLKCESPDDSMRLAQRRYDAQITEISQRLAMNNDEADIHKPKEQRPGVSPFDTHSTGHVDGSVEEMGTRISTPVTPVAQCASNYHRLRMPNGSPLKTSHSMPTGDQYTFTTESPSTASILSGSSSAVPVLSATQQMSGSMDYTSGVVVPQSVTGNPAGRIGDNNGFSSYMGGMLATAPWPYTNKGYQSFSQPDQRTMENNRNAIYMLNGFPSLTLPGATYQTIPNMPSDPDSAQQSSQPFEGSFLGVNHGLQYKAGLSRNENGPGRSRSVDGLPLGMNLGNRSFTGHAPSTLGQMSSTVPTEPHICSGTQEKGSNTKQRC